MSRPHPEEMEEEEEEEEEEGDSSMAPSAGSDKTEHSVSRRVHRLSNSTSGASSCLEMIPASVSPTTPFVQDMDMSAATED